MASERRVFIIPTLPILKKFPKPAAARRIAARFLLLLWLLWLAGQWLRDFNSVSAFLFYIPSPAVLVLLAAGTMVTWRRKHRHFALTLSAMAIVPAIWVMFVENRFFHTRETPSGPQLRMVHWNVCRGWIGWEAIQKRMRDERPDLCVISEFPTEAKVSETTTNFGEDWSGMDLGGMAVIAKGKLVHREWLSQRDGVKACGVVWNSPQGACRVMAVDLDSSLLIPRGSRLEKVRRLMNDWKPDLVVGDFNAPRRSIGLDPLPEGFSHAYDKAGSGWSYTWPVPFPCYAIDQCMAGKQVVALRYEIESSFRSDHRMQVLDFTLDTLNHP